MSYLLGLTGSMGMGKSTTAGFFTDAGVPVWDADAVVHGLYAKGGAAVALIKALAPDAITDGAVDRQKLRQAIAADRDLLAQIESAIHPLLADNRAEFIRENDGNPLLLFDIPLLFETDARQWLDGVLVVTAPPETQMERLVARNTMTREQIAAILARQLPDAQKRAQADFIIDTSRGIDAARQDVLALINRLGQN